MTAEMLTFYGATARHRGRIVFTWRRGMKLFVWLLFWFPTRKKWNGNIINEIILKKITQPKDCSVEREAGTKRTRVRCFFFIINFFSFFLFLVYLCVCISLSFSSLLFFYTQWSKEIGTKVNRVCKVVKLSIVVLCVVYRRFFLVLVSFSRNAIARDWCDCDLLNLYIYIFFLFGEGNKMCNKTFIRMNLPLVFSFLLIQ